MRGWCASCRRPPGHRPRSHCLPVPRQPRRRYRCAPAGSRRRCCPPPPSSGPCGARSCLCGYQMCKSPSVGFLLPEPKTLDEPFHRLVFDRPGRQ
ncbi:MAG: hypothetical protein EOO16_03310 [Chitinophagaceae bacterium]|nr:MAG: hypothetical protein EOO16_03310 [Chitinophagaceae bacterium]